MFQVRKNAVKMGSLSISGGDARTDSTTKKSHVFPVHIIL